MYAISVFEVCSCVVNSFYLLDHYIQICKSTFTHPSTEEGALIVHLTSLPQLILHDGFRDIKASHILLKRIIRLAAALQVTLSFTQVQQGGKLI